MNFCSKKILMAPVSIYAFCWVILCLLLTSQCINSIHAREIKEKKLKNNDIDDVHLLLNKHKHISLPNDPTLNVYFHIQDLKVGNTIPIYFSLKNTSNSPHILSREESDSIPFSSSNLSQILNFFSFHNNSPQAKAMATTLKECESEALKGEYKFCATSLESMLDSARGVFGLDADFKVLMTEFISKHSVELQNYVVLEENEVLTPKMLGCHPVAYPYRVYYCHGQESDIKLFKIKLKGENGERVDALGVCHIDTSEWEPEHVAFRVLGISPGQGPVCHFFPADNLIWAVSKNTM